MKRSKATTGKRKRDWKAFKELTKPPRKRLSAEEKLLRRIFGD